MNVGIDILERSINCIFWWDIHVYPIYKAFEIH